MVVCFIFNFFFHKQRGIAEREREKTRPDIIHVIVSNQSVCKTVWSLQVTRPVKKDFVPYFLYSRCFNGLDKRERTIYPGRLD